MRVDRIVDNYEPPEVRVTLVLVHGTVTTFPRAVCGYSHRFHVPCVDIHTVFSCRVWIFTPCSRAVCGYSHRLHVPYLNIHTVFTCRI